MADRRGVRSANRRKTPTPQPPDKATAPQLGRVSRTRTLRSASREVEDLVDVQKPTRRGARQGSVTTVTEESQIEARTARSTKRQPAKETLGDLTIVEEMDTQVAIEEDGYNVAPGTPTRSQPEDSVPFCSPGAASEMSGTTAISSFSMVEAECLESRFILKHLRKLCESTEEFLEHIAPAEGTMRDDLANIQEMQKPGSYYGEEYLDYDLEVNVHLKHFKSEEHSYIHIRALHRALFGTNEPAAASQTGLDLVLFQANLLIFAKQMMHSNRDDKRVWDVLRQLDNTFPGQFMHSLERDAQPTAVGESALLKETFELALELRTQLAILVLQKSMDNTECNPDEMVSEIFFRSESSQAVDGSPIRGWNMSALGGDDSPLSQEFQDQVVKRLNKIREYFPMDDPSSERGEVVDIERLRAYFPWEPAILRLLEWVRLRRSELDAVIGSLGGSIAIARNVKRVFEEPHQVVEQAPVQQQSLRRKRRSFGGGRRRSSRKFNPTAPVDPTVMDKWAERERDSGVHLEVNVQEQGEPHVQPAVHEIEVDQYIMENQQDDFQPILGDDEEPEEQQLEEQPSDEQPPVEQQIEDVEEQVEEVEEQIEQPEAPGPPQTSAALLRALKAGSRPQKENRPVSIFDRQATAQRVEFGDGFDDTQPTPGPSSIPKAKDHTQTSPRKRRRPIDDSDDSDADAFETEDRGARATERRRHAPVTKKVRMNPSSSAAAPPSHQPPRPTPRLPRELEQAESVSEPDAPEMTEEVPSSLYQAQTQLAKENRLLEIPQRRNERKARQEWTTGAEEAFCEYMRLYPAKYSAIIKYDAAQEQPMLEGRTQVNLKDKARNMAINMIKSGTGLMPGFENIVHPNEKYGKGLVASGWEMRGDGSWERRGR
ncbi:hypothetical protein A1F94_009754 [Pyrenophora tritici-repentis]|uniref:Uncharacterized protein n=3 Tax=Pyrenophora tritici-repentis TaxID=45151 RepID=A0A2W1FEV1_9PLEO|nr:uncharacterized protein PTRG_08296 [Pyrenophora tritici-repentis Pt-1C-BFP]KAF7443658.1 hypothetical protein A1F99_117320 [Pyrenophora tritici-repentis]EDU51215.1 predicted protein [Pyrenophora tritici-repentis Pt-1C-BFP]KAG9379398.1 hypothetical protein A1F94_009754 [Pyrenophora tritici-repentis]KAI0577826.1 hypothetical protein Alg215_06687 [Pyrenophora tritici-repentis]KAI1519568.1 hypothetical protein Ptr86124_002696 [Pyrenophora tritici-repentis]